MYLIMQDFINNGRKKIKRQTHSPYSENVCDLDKINIFILRVAVYAVVEAGKSFCFQILVYAYYNEP